MSQIDQPPPFQPVNVIELNSVTDSTITGVSVYSNRAEVTRLFKFNIRTGQNQFIVSGLPNVLDQDSLRVEGNGAATIHDVTISTIVPPPSPTSSDTLKELLDKKRCTEKALARAKKSVTALETYLASLKIQYLDASNLREVVNSYDTAAEELDDRIAELENTLFETDEAILVEKRGTKGNAKLNLKVSIGVFADFEGEIKITLIYAVRNATWNPGYDIRIDMKTKDKPVTLTYKGGIAQNTGEDWVDVPLTLETSTPTFGLEVPTLTPWNISIYHQSQPTPMAPRLRGKSTCADLGPMVIRSVLSSSSSSGESRSPTPAIEYRRLDVSSKGNISATFRVPGLISIPSDGIIHNVAIAKLTLDAKMSWVCVPKVDVKTHLNAKIKNASEYTFLNGQVNVYVDGSFISKSDIPLVSPEESFDCPLGVDPSIRVTYHPRSKKVSQSGYYTNTTNYVFSQHITVSNTKTLPIQNLKIIDQVPVSEDSDITVKLVSPALSSTGGGEELKAPAPLRVASGVNAQWHGADDTGVEVEALGRDGKLNWVCAVPAQGKISLVLQWEVTTPVKTAIRGLS